jgi:hypothetical protein
MAGDPAVYLIAGTAASVMGVLTGARSFYVRQKKRWTDEGARGQRNTKALEDNTRAAAENTQAIGALTIKLDTFATETRDRLSGHDLRIGRLEDVIEGPMRTRRHPGEDPR